MISWEDGIFTGNGLSVRTSKSSSDSGVTVWIHGKLQTSNLPKESDNDSVVMDQAPDGTTTVGGPSL